MVKISEVCRNTSLLRCASALVLALCVLFVVQDSPAQSILGKHPSDKILDALFSGTNGQANADAIIQGLNTKGTKAGTNTTVFGTGGGSASITPFGVSSTNTFYAVNTNAITLLTNAIDNTNIVYITGSDSNSYNGAWYWSSGKSGYTNATVGAGTVFAADSSQGVWSITNASHNDSLSDFAYGSGSVDYIASAGEWFYGPDGGAGSDANMVSVWATNYNYLPKFIGNGSALVNLPAPSGVITNNWQSGAGQIFLTNKVTVMGTEISRGDIRYNFAVPYSNFFILTSNQFKFNGSAGAFGHYEFMWGDSGQAFIHWNNDGGWLNRATYIGMEVPVDFSTIRITDDHRLDGLMKLGVQSIGGLVFPSNNFSGMLAFQAPITNGAGTYIPGYGGIRAKNATGVEVQNINGEPMSHVELWFYTLIPPQLSNSLGGFRSVGDTNHFLIGRTNGIFVQQMVWATNGYNSFATDKGTITTTGWTNTLGKVACIFGLTGVSIVQTNADGIGFSRGTITAPTDVVLQSGAKIQGTSIAAGQIQAF